GLLDHLGGDRGTGDHRRADLDGAVAPEHQHLVQSDGRTRLGVETLDRNKLFRRDPVLLPAGADDCEHGQAAVDLGGTPLPAGPEVSKNTYGRQPRRRHPFRERGTIVRRASLSMSEWAATWLDLGQTGSIQCLHGRTLSTMVRAGHAEGVSDRPPRLAERC